MATLIMKGKMWYADMRMDGKRIRRALSKFKPEAKRMLAELVYMRSAARQGGIVQHMTWAFFKKDFLRKSKLNDGLATFYANRRAFEVVDEVMLVRDLSRMTPETLIEIHARLKEKKYPPVTIVRSIRAIVTAMRRAEDLKYVPIQNWRIVKWAEPKGRLDFYEIDRFDELIHRLSGVWKTAAWLMGRAGLRLGEAQHLEWPDVQFHNHRILFKSKPELNWHIKGDKTGSKVRTVAMTRGLEAHLKSIARPSGFVLDGVSRTREVFGKQMSAALKDTGVRTYLGKFGFPHILRHTFGSHLAQSSVYEGTIAELMGHSTTKMVKIYSHLRPLDLKKGVAMLPELGSTFSAISETKTEKLGSTLCPVSTSDSTGTLRLTTLNGDLASSDSSSKTH